jgi:hypothetical protein
MSELIRECEMLQNYIAELGITYKEHLHIVKKIRLISELHTDILVWVNGNSKKLSKYTEPELLDIYTIKNKDDK